MIAQMFSTDKRFIGKGIGAARRPLTPTHRRCGVSPPLKRGALRRDLVIDVQPDGSFTVVFYDNNVTILNQIDPDQTITNWFNTCLNNNTCMPNGSTTINGYVIGKSNLGQIEFIMVYRKNTVVDP